MNLNNKKYIVFVSISSDLYGSSKLLLTLVLNLKKLSKVYQPIVCMPCEEGLLKDKLTSEQVEIIEMPILKLKRSMLKTLKFGTFYKEYKEAKKIFHDKLNGREIHCIHSNTLATMFGSIYCFRKSTFHIFHVHEIMDTPKLIKYFFSFIQLFFADKIVYNSKATEKFYINTLSALKTDILKINDKNPPYLLNHPQIIGRFRVLKTNILKINLDDFSPENIVKFKVHLKDIIISHNALVKTMNSMVNKTDEVETINLGI